MTHQTTIRTFRLTGDLEPVYFVDCDDPDCDLVEKAHGSVMDANAFAAEHMQEVA